MENINKLDVVKIRECTLLKNLTEASLYKLYWLIERRLYKEGSLIIPQSKRSEINFDYLDFYDEQNIPTQDALEVDLDENFQSLSDFQKALARIKVKKISKKLSSADKGNKSAIFESFKTLKEKFEKRLSKHSSFITDPEQYYDCSNINFDTDINGIYIINKGVWKVINRKDNYTWWELFKGDCFGESEIINFIDWTYFGDVYAKSDVDVMFISYENIKKIPYFEFESMLKSVKGKFRSVLYTISRRYTTKLWILLEVFVVKLIEILIFKVIQLKF